MRAALYLRVSTSRQAEKDLSIPDQRRQATSYCEAKRWQVCAEFVEPGASATDDRRPAFQRMIEMACASDRPFDVVIIHSFSRFFRDAFQLEFYFRKLRKHGVRLVSLTQDTGDDPTSQMIRQIMALFDEYQSRENAKHTLRAMKENARQGFWNGSRPPFGYRVVEAERRGEKTKKRLEVEPAEAEMVRRIFELYRQGTRDRGPLGVKAIASHLNENGYRSRGGGRFSIKTVHEILTRTAYAGRHRFNQFDSRSKQKKPAAEWIEVEVPPIIDAETFQAVQSTLDSRNPRKTPPRVVSGPILLTGIATCATCGGGMTLRTGKSGRYRYYACATCARIGKTACKGRSIPMDTLDGLVMDTLTQRVLTPDHITELLAALVADAVNDQDRQKERLDELAREQRDVESRLNRLFEAVETGTVPDGAILRSRLDGLYRRRDELTELVALARRRLEKPSTGLTPNRINEFTAVMRDRLTSGPVPFRKAYLRLFVDKVEVDDGEIRIGGSKAALADSLKNLENLSAGAVPTFVQNWRPGRDSNP